jgi:superfamily II DNA or RNA helicase
MIKITINNSYSYIKGLDLNEHYVIKKLLSYNINSYYTKFPIRRYLIDTKGKFLTGLLYIVKEWLKKNNKPYQITDERKRPERLLRPMILKINTKPYKWQIKASNACLKHYRGIIIAPTGAGKSLSIAMIIQNLQVSTLIVVPNLTIREQLISYLTDIFGKNRVGRFKDHKTIAVDNIDALPVTYTFDYDCLIIDEFHHSAAKTYRRLNSIAWKNAYYRYGLTATNFRSKNEENILLKSILSEVIYELDYKTAVKEDCIVPIEAYYVESPKIDIDSNSWREVYNKLIVNNNERNKIIYNILLKLSSYKLNTLCLVKEIEHGKNLSSSFSNFISAESVHTEALIKKFNENKIHSLIGTTGVLGEGIDTKPAEYIIIAGLGKSKNSFMQQVGRGLRRYPGKESCKVIIFLDKSHKWTISHFKQQKRFLIDEYGVNVVKLDL